MQTSETNKVILKVNGMSCSGCVNSVNQVLRKLPGVTDVSVVLQTGLVTVRHDPSKTTVAELSEAITEAGYEVQSAK